MAKCAKCGTTIKNVYYVDGKGYGCECFKSALNEKRIIEGKKYQQLREEKTQQLQHDKELKYIAELDNNKVKAEIIIEVLKSKNINKITNEYKLKMYNEIIESYNNKGSLNNYLIGVAMNKLITTKKDLKIFYSMYLESLNDELLIDEIYNFSKYWYEGIEEEIINKLEYLKNNYTVRIEIYNDIQCEYINNIMINEIEL